MCTSIVEIAGAKGAGRSMDGWFSLTHSVVAYDHPQHALLEEAVTIDFVNHAKGAGARAAFKIGYLGSTGFLSTWPGDPEEGGK